MENVFPSLLTYTFFAPLILRLFIAGAFFSDAKKYWDKRERWWIPDGIALVIGAFLLVGYATQLAAIAGIGYLAFVYYKKDHESVFSTKETSLLALGILISFLATGAGAYAFDLPY
ncbi:hypothetical protein HY090_01405 [Candidatus Kaiserbacteria bacterium]|nr:hypothetical protein [Candidatus Kaiserbacteria bacterium]